MLKLSKVYSKKTFSTIILPVVISVFLLNVFFVFAQRNLVRNWGEKNIFLLTDLIIQRQDANLQNAHQLALVLSNLNVVKGHDVSGCNQTFKDILESNPLYANLAVSDTNGDTWCSALPMTESVNVKDEAYFQEVLETKDFSVGKYAIGLVSHIPSIHVAYPVVDSRGSLIGVIRVAIRLDWFNTIFLTANIPNNYNIVIVDFEGTILAHYPTNNVGDRVKEKDILEALSEKPLKTSFTSSEPDGIERLYAIEPFSDKAGESIYIVAGIPTSELNETINKTTVNNIIVSVAVIFITFMVTFVDSRFLKSRQPHSE